jgi:cytochrome bd-type quinol oxidase subunit 1
MAADVLQVLVMTGSIIVSSLSAWWIIKQAKNLDRINREAEQKRLKDAE